MKEIKDYLHLYPNVYVQFKDEKQKVENYGEFEKACITGLFENPAGAGLMAQLCVDDWEEPLEVMVDEITPEFRPLSDMTEEEIKQIAWLQHNYKAEDVRGKDSVGNIKVVNRSPFYYFIHPLRNTTPEAVIYLLSKHFDLFGLIEANMALDKTTLNMKEDL